MYKSSEKLLDEVFRDTEHYRCEYLEILTEKYVNNSSDEIVDIDLKTFTIYKFSTNCLKKFSKKEFGSVTSYNCKSAQKNIKYLQKKIFLEKREFSRNQAGVELSAEKYHSSKCKRNRKYLTPNKVTETLLSVQEFECNETKLRDEHHSVSSIEESERTLSPEGNPAFSLDTSKKKRNSVSTSLINDQKSAANNVTQFFNSKLKNFTENLLKFNYKSMTRVLIENFNPLTSNSCDNNFPKSVNEKQVVLFNNVSSSGSKEKKGSFSSDVSVSHFSSVYDLNSKMSRPKFKFAEFGIGIAPKINQNKIKSLPRSSDKLSVTPISNNSKMKLQTPDKSSCFSNLKLLSSSKKSSVHLRMKMSNKNCQILQDSQTLKSAYLLSSDSFENSNCESIDAFKQVSDDRKPSKQKSSIAQNTLLFRKSESHNNSKHKDYLENFITIDDLSLRKSPSNRKTHKKMQKGVYTQ